MKKVVYIISLASIIFASCSFIVPYRIKRDFKYCFTGEKTGLDTLINVNGYYAPDAVIREGNKILPKDTLSPAYVFYNNGFVFRAAIRAFIENKKIILRGMVEPGGYVLHGDTIKFQFVNAPGGQSRDLVEIWFKIIDRNTIERISIGEDFPLKSYAERIYIFRPLEIRVNPEDTWIYKKSWFRCKKK